MMLRSLAPLRRAASAGPPLNVPSLTAPFAPFARGMRMSPVHAVMPVMSTKVKTALPLSAAPSPKSPPPPPGVILAAGAIIFAAFHSHTISSCTDGDHDEEELDTTALGDSSCVDSGPVPTLRCIICYEEKEGTIVSAEGHPTCVECLAPFVAINADALSKTDLIASMADAAAARNDTAAVAKFEGRCLCPLSGHGCNAGPFEEKDVAAHVPPDVFSALVGSKVHLPLARKLQDVVAKKQELSLQFPNARQCGRCSHGPVLFRRRRL